MVIVQGTKTTLHIKSVARRTSVPALAHFSLSLPPHWLRLHECF